MTLHMLLKCCQCRCRCVIIHLQLNYCLNPQFRCAILRISFRAVVSCVLPTRLCQFVKLYLLLLKPLQALWYHSGDCANDPAGFVIFAQLAMLCLFIIFIFPSLPIVGTCKITQTVSNRNHHLLKSLFGLSVRQSGFFNFLHIFLLVLNRCLCVLNMVSCPSDFSVNIMLDWVVFLFITSEMCFSSFLSRKLLLASRPAQHPKGLDSFRFEAALDFIRWVKSFVLTLFLGEMLDVPRYGQYGGKLRLSCQG